MNPQEKAKELIEKYLRVEDDSQFYWEPYYDRRYLDDEVFSHSVKCAIIAVEEIIASQPKTVSAIGFGSAQVTNPDIQFWKEVLNELKEKL